MAAGVVRPQSAGPAGSAPCGAARPTGPDPKADSPAEEPSAETLDPLGPNAACYVCHMTFVREAISRVHAAAKVGCIRCHGLSADHANDENVGATPPDRRYRREDVDQACGDCHKTHRAWPQDVVARFLRRQLPADRPAICTDCHGRHRIDRAAATR